MSSCRKIAPRPACSVSTNMWTYSSHPRFWPIPLVSRARTAIAPIRRDLKIIVKRGIPFDNIMMPLPEDKPVSFILEANPYRAALIEYAKSRGILTLVATAGGAGGQLDDLNAEQERVTAFVQGKAAVNESDLVRIFHLPPIQPPVPPLRVEHYAGTDMKKVEILDPTNGKAMPVLGYHFMIPEGATIQAGRNRKPATRRRTISA